jgi:ankyrin repeat protein
MGGSKELVMFLLNLGANPNHVNHWGKTALHRAAFDGLSPIAALLLGTPRLLTRRLCLLV